MAMLTNPLITPPNDFDPTPGTYGDVTRVVEVIVSDTAKKRVFSTLDGQFLGEWRGPVADDDHRRLTQLQEFGRKIEEIGGRAVVEADGYDLKATPIRGERLAILSGRQVSVREVLPSELRWKNKNEGILEGEPLVPLDEVLNWLRNWEEFERDQPASVVFARDWAAELSKVDHAPTPA